jgi:hypothetical protein
MSVESKVSPKLFYGLSTDAKPTTDVPICSVYIETDTGDEFLWLDTWTQHKGSLSTYMTMTTLLSGENAAAFAGGFIQVAATGPEYVEPDLSGATAYNAWDTHKKLILGFDYYGPGGLIYFEDYSGNLTYATMRDSASVGWQSKACQARVMYQQGAGGAPSTAYTGDFTIGLYLTKVIRE